MKAKRRRDEIDERRRGLKFEAGEIAVAREVSLQLMPADARPVVGGLEREIHIFRGFQFQNGKAAAARNAQEIYDAVLAGDLSENLFVHVFGIERDINAAYILLHEGLHPALGLGPI